MRPTFFAAFILFAAHPAYAGTAATAHPASAGADATPHPIHAGGVAISMDEVRIITFLNPVATVYVGNSSIADVNIIDDHHAFVVGKIPGITNIVALDHQGDQVSNTHVNVMAREASTVTLQRGATKAAPSARLTYSCVASHCDETPTPGDNLQDFNKVSNEINTHETTAKGDAALQK